MFQNAGMYLVRKLELFLKKIQIRRKCVNLGRRKNELCERMFSGV